LRGERADQHLPKIAPVDLGTIAGEAAGVIEQNDAGFINDTFRVFPATDKAEELVKSACGLQGKLTASRRLKALPNPRRPAQPTLVSLCAADDGRVSR
jgi:hypothetical protein